MRQRMSLGEVDRMHRKRSPKTIEMSGSGNGIPSPGLCVTFVAFGLFCIGWACSKDGGEVPFGRFYATGFGLLFSGLGLWLSCARFHIRRLASEPQIYARFGLDAVRLADIVMIHDIQPRYRINGRGYYDLRDFGDATTLLRACTEPHISPELLLRPVTNPQSAPADQLLRSHHAPREADAPLSL